DGSGGVWQEPTDRLELHYSRPRAEPPDRVQHRRTVERFAQRGRARRIGRPSVIQRPLFDPPLYFVEVVGGDDAQALSAEWHRTQASTVVRLGLAPEHAALLVARLYPRYVGHHCTATGRGRNVDKL